MVKIEKVPVYEWNVAYRLDHWVRVLAIAVLTVTGFYIHWPFISGGEAAGTGIMDWMRFAHFISSYVLLLGLVVRIYLAFNSGFDADWRDFGPFRNIKNIPDVLLYYLFLKKDHKEYRRYNPFQALTYLFWAFLVLFMVLTGFGLYHGKVFGLWDSQEYFGWVNRILGGESYTRILHFLGMWIFLVTTAIHVYMAVLYSLVHRDHTLRSILTGYKVKPSAGLGGNPK